MEMIDVYKCLRCGHEWAGRLNREPKVCPKCNSPYWNKPKVKQSGPKRKTEERPEHISDGYFDINRVIFEKGIEFIKMADKSWTCTSSVKPNIRVTRDIIASTYKVREVLHEGGTFRPQVPLLLPIQMGGLLTIRVAVISQNADKSRFYPLMNVGYLLRSVCHHCTRVAYAYAKIINEHLMFEDFRRKSKKSYEGNKVGFGQDEQYFELEACLTSVIRLHETLRYLIWSKFCSGLGSTPGSYESTIKRAREHKRIPKELNEYLRTEWEPYASVVKDYRDCIQHYVPIPSPWPFALMEKLNDAIWSCHSRIPDNPKERSPNKFKFNKEIDALTYAWETTNKVVECVEKILCYID